MPNQDGIAEREVHRITQWPGQVISYKIGEARIRRLRAAAATRAGFDDKKFHKRILEHGPIPLTVLDRIMQDE